MVYKGTLEVSKILRVKPATLSTALWSGRIQAPEKGPGGAFLWTTEDIKRAAHYFGVQLNQEGTVNV